LSSAELDEVMSLSDRIAVISKGRVIGVYPADAVTKEQLGLLMAGGQAAGEPSATAAPGAHM